MTRPQTPTLTARTLTGMQQITIAWEDDTIVVQSDQGQERVEDIGAALQMVLDAYKRSAEENVGESDYMAAFRAAPQRNERQPTQSDSATAMRG